MRKVFSLFSSLALVLTTVTVAQAASVTVDSLNDSFKIKYNGTDDNINGTLDPWLSATVDFVVTAYGSNSLTLQGTLKNTTQAPYDSRVTGLGFDVNPDPTSGSVSGVFTTAVFGGALNAHGIQDTFDVCVKNGPATNCNGSNGGVSAGQTGIFYLTLNFTSNIAGGVSFDNFVDRYQGITYPAGQTGSGSGAGRGCIVGVDANCSDTPGDPVPEPTTMVLTGLGLLGASFVARRRR